MRGRGIGLILHLGAKIRETAFTGITVDDPDNMLRWLANDLATVVFADLDYFRPREAAFRRLIQSGIACV